MVLTNQYGTERRVKNALAAISATSGVPAGGRGRHNGFFWMRCAGLVACANRKNRQPVPGSGRHGERNAQTTAKRERQIAVGRSCTQSVITGSTGDT